MNRSVIYSLLFTCAEFVTYFLWLATTSRPLYLAFFPPFFVVFIASIINFNPWSILLLGLIIGSISRAILGIRQVKRTNERGKFLGVVILILNVLFLLCLIGFLLSLFNFGL